MLRQLFKLVSRPRRYVPLARTVLQQKMSPHFQNTSFFLQGQMDIHPNSRWYVENFVASTGGFYPGDGSQDREICNLEPWDNTRRDMLALLLRTLVAKNIAGNLAELGVYQGQTAKLIHYYLPERQLYLFDTFEGFTDQSVSAEKAHTDSNIPACGFADTSLELVKHYISQKNGNVHYCKGYFPGSIPDEVKDLPFAFVHLDADLYEPIFEGLKFFYPRMSPRGFIVVHDYNAWHGARKAVDDFFGDKPELPIPLPDKSGSVLIVKQESPLMKDG